MPRDNHHDSLFRFAFSRLDVAAEHLRFSLPASIVSQCQWSDLTIEAGSYVDTELHNFHSDILYQVPLQQGGGLLVYVLFEHQRKVDYFMPLRLLQYMGRIWQRWQRQNTTGELPIIAPIVLYNGARRWTAARDFQALTPVCTMPEMLPYTPHFSFILQDLASIPDDHFRGLALRELVLLLLKHSDSADFWKRFPEWIGSMQRLWRQPGDGRHALTALLRYIITVGKKPSQETYQLLIDSLSPEAEGNMTTWAESLREEGFEIGIKQGRQEGCQEGIEKTTTALLVRARQRVEKMLQLKFQPISAAHLAAVQAADLDTLERWTIAILTAPTADDALQ